MRNIQSLRFLGAILLPALLSAASPQTITFRPIANQIFGAPPVLAVAQASSGLPVSLISASPAVCKVDAELVTLVGAGLCTLTAGQNGNATWSAAVSVRQTFMVNPAKTSGALSPAPGSPFGIWANGQAVVTADFNMDGIPDIATANGKANNVTLLLGDGKGGFANAAGSPFAAGTGAFSLVAADLNGDGFPDLAVVDSSGLTVLLGNGQGGFPVTSTIPLAPGAGPSAVAVGDFNGDGFPDLAVADRINSAVIPLIGNGKGSFTPGATLTLGNSYLGPVSLVVADFNGDGFQDLAVASQVSGTIAILTGNGLGGFAPVSASLVKVGAQPFSLATGDFNGDGMPDLATADNAGNTVSVMLGNGSGAFSPAPGSPYAISSPWAIAVGDFNGDGFTDLILGTASGVTVLTGNGRGGFSVINGTPAAAIPISIATADFNGDGMLDLATANYESSTVTVLLGGMASTSLVLSTTATPTVPLGQAIPLAATVSDVGVPFSSPTGLVVFYDGATPLGAAAQTVGPYSFTASGLNGGTHILTAAYGGDANSSPSTSNAVTIQEGGPSPVLSSLNPSQWTPGGATFTLTVTGMNFVQTSQLQWNGLTLPAKFVSATQITVSIPVGVIAVAGPAALAVVNPGNSLSNTVQYQDILPTVTTLNPTTWLQGGASFMLIVNGTNFVQSSQVQWDGTALVTKFVNPTQLSAAVPTATLLTADVSATILVANPGNALSNAVQYSAILPTITSLSPANWTVGGGAFNLTVTGTGFTASSQVQWNGSALQTKFISATQLSAAVLPAFIASTGMVSITVLGAGGSLTNALPYSEAPPVIVSLNPANAVVGGPDMKLCITGAGFSSGATVYWNLTAISTTFGSPTSLCASVTAAMIASQAQETIFVTNPDGSGSNLVLFNIVPPVPTINKGGVVPIYSSSNTIQPSSWISIFGTFLANGTYTWNSDFPTSLGGTSVTIDGKPAYLWSVSPTQINLQAPDDMATGSVVVSVMTPYGPTTSTVTLAAQSPSFSLISATYPAAIILTPNGSGAYGNGTYDLLGPTGAFAFNTRPVKAGETLVLYGVGFGPTNPAVPAGAVYNGVAPTISPVTVTIGGKPATVLFAGLVGAGLYQITVTVPKAPSGDEPLIAKAGTAQTQASIAVTVQ